MRIYEVISNTHTQLSLLHEKYINKYIYIYISIYEVLCITHMSMLLDKICSFFTHRAVSFCVTYIHTIKEKKDLKLSCTFLE
jgi:hypothetical protein